MHQHLETVTLNIEHNLQFNNITLDGNTESGVHNLSYNPTFTHISFRFTIYLTHGPQAPPCNWGFACGSGSGYRQGTEVAL